MSDTVIRVENLGKKYIIGRQKQEKYLTLRDAIAQTARSVGQHFLPSKHKEKPRFDQEEFWALKDVSFEIKQGDRVGIIGRNGAGKSTLLKILSRITEPTTGRISIKGRVASLLEVGTGFHPELTGRENIFLNGAILGMGKTEISRKFDEIVAFAEVEKFLDTPVKRYSSGMYVRLAFAIAAHLEPEILVVDEVLAVGDAQFQKKCLGKMENIVQNEGKTVIFVSHNMAAIQSLCNIGIVLDHGSLKANCLIGEATYYYSELIRSRDLISLRTIRWVEILNTRISHSVEQERFTAESPLIAEIDFFTDKHLPNCHLNLVIEDFEGQVLIHSRTDFLGQIPSFNPGLHRARVKIPRLGIRAGAYILWFRLYVNSGDIMELADSERIILEVDGLPSGGIVSVPCKWSWTKVEA